MIFFHSGGYTRIDGSQFLVPLLALPKSPTANMRLEHKMLLFATQLLVLYVILGLDASSIRLQLLDAPPIDEEEWNSTDQHPIGEGFICEQLDDKIVIWAGCQKQRDGRWTPLPNDVVYCFSPSANNNGTWNTIPATGSIHPGRMRAASTTVGSLIYIIGGVSELPSELTDAVSTLNSNGEFETLQPINQPPLPSCTSYL